MVAVAEDAALERFADFAAVFVLPRLGVVEDIFGLGMPVFFCFFTEEVEEEEEDDEDEEDEDLCVERPRLVPVMVFLATLTLLPFSFSVYGMRSAVIDMLVCCCGEGNMFLTFNLLFMKI